MKLTYTFIILLLSYNFAHAQSKPADTTLHSQSHEVFTAVQRVPSYPGGIQEFYHMIGNDLKYPEVAQLTGINGEVRVSFVVDTDGKVSKVTPINCIGAGCESEAVKAIYCSKLWLPAIQNNKPARVEFTVPIRFTIKKENVTMHELRKSKYAFVFDIKGTLYTINDAEAILGKSFPSNIIELSTPYAATDKFPQLEGQEVYLLKIKES